MRYNQSGKAILVMIVWTTMMSFSGKVLGRGSDPEVRIARLKIDSTKLQAYKNALREEIAAAIRIEPGVLSLYAVYEKDDPTRVTVFEIYASEAAYRSHIQTPHFRKYKETTAGMVRSLELIPVTPIALGSKPGPLSP